MPDVLHDKQTKVIFLPETHLPKKPRVVDLKRFLERRKKLHELPSPKPEALAKLLKRPADCQAKDQDIIKGDITEKELMEELKKFFVAADDQEVVVFFGPELKIPGKEGKTEHDVIVVHKSTRTIYVIEAKTSLSAESGAKSVRQIEQLKDHLQEFFSDSDWRFASLVYCRNINGSVCTACSPFVIEGVEELEEKLNAVLKSSHASVSNRILHKGYLLLVQRLAFVVLAHPVSTFYTIAIQVQAKVEGVPAKKAGKRTKKAKP